MSKPTRIVVLIISLSLLGLISGCGTPKDLSSESTTQDIIVYIEPSGDECLGSGNVKAGNSVVLVEVDPQTNPRTQPELARGELYGREAGCGLGAHFVLESSQHASYGTVYDETSDQILGNIELTIDGNTTIYLNGSVSNETNEDTSPSPSEDITADENSILDQPAANFFITGTSLATLQQVWGIKINGSSGPKTLGQVADEIYFYLGRSVGRKVTASELEIGFQTGNSMQSFFSRLIDNVWAYQAMKDRLIYNANL